MKIYLTGAFEHMDRRVGFGNASYYIYNELIKAGLDVSIKPLDNNESYHADVELCFDQPNRYKFMCPTSYKIGYTPWESTEFFPSWYRPLNSCDEIWTTSYWNQQIFQQRLPHKEIFTYQHGLDQIYKPKKRKYDQNQPFTFLFIGEPYWRKDGQSVAEIFAEFYGDNPDYRLIIKATKMNTIRLNKNNVPGSPEALYSNIITITDLLPQEEILKLYEYADVFVYPSWGEGFGFNPLQAMGMGIPTISTHEWSDYAKYITFPIDSHIHPSPWPEIHPGYMLKPNRMQLRTGMREIKNKYDEAAAIAFKNSMFLHQEFNWEKVSAPAIKRLQNIFSTLELKT
jgi:glycosyltransferase involved in cell wall biosynthesis